MRAAAILLFLTAVASAAPAEPSGPHPRILLDASLRAAWKAGLQEERGPLVGAVALCDESATDRHEGALYMGAEWAKMLQACLVAWAATDKPAYAASALRYFIALLDDLEKIGDGKGGDRAAIRDSGYAIRNLGPNTAIAYDWLHGVPGMTPELRARARQRWAAWLSSFKEEGYHPRDPGSNYHAGYLAAATLIAIAQAGEAGEAGQTLWKLVADELWSKDMAAALASGGVLDGGDWNEGWQYGPLAVATYAMAARVARANGIKVEGTSAWLASVLRRHVYGLTPADRLWAGGDFDSEEVHMPPQVLALTAVALGDASPDDKRWAKGELGRLKLTDKDYLLYSALATIGDAPATVPRTSWPTWYQAAATATLFTRTSWEPRAVWFVAACAQTHKLDHRSPNAGNFVLSRGADDLIVDPSPYGSLSTLTGNAPTVLSKHLPHNYVPSQGAWGEAIAWRWTTKTRGGVVAARCDYADAYRFQHRKSDVPEALRDFVLLPSADGRDASLVIVDRARTGEPERKMYLRFRVPAALAIDQAGTGTATIGDARLVISGDHAPVLGRTALKDCFKEGTLRGSCDAARFAVTDYRVEIAGPEPRAVHVIDAIGAGVAATHRRISGDSWTGVAIGGTRAAVVVWPNKRGRELTYRAPKGTSVTHVVLDAPASAGKAAVSARLDGDACAVTVAAGDSAPATAPATPAPATPAPATPAPATPAPATPAPATPAPATPAAATPMSATPVSATPVIVSLDEACAVTADPELPGGISAEGKPASVPGKPRVRRSGCCGAQRAPGSPIAMSVVLLALVRRSRPHGRRKRR